MTIIRFVTSISQTNRKATRCSTRVIVKENKISCYYVHPANSSNFLNILEMAKNHNTLLTFTASKIINSVITL